MTTGLDYESANAERLKNRMQDILDSCSREELIEALLPEGDTGPGEVRVLIETSGGVCMGHCKVVLVGSSGERYLTRVDMMAESVREAISQALYLVELFIVRKRELAGISDARP